MANSPLDGTVLDDILAIAPTLHSAGPSSPKVLRAIAQHLGGRLISGSAETGSGASTILFSRLSEHHTVFALDDGSGSIARVRSSLLFNPATTTFVEGPTQDTLPRHRFERRLQVALLDGPHAFPFPQLEYYYLYPHLEEGAVLVVDDIHIPSVHQLYRFLKADQMFQLVGVVDRAALFRRTSAPPFDPLGDGWHLQGYNRRPLLRFTWVERLRKAIPEPVRASIKNSLHYLTGAGVRLWEGRHPWVRILEPQGGERVGSAGVVRGAASIPPNTSLWLFARREDQNGWWPQAGCMIELKRGGWEQPCKYGEPSDVGRKFEIAAVVVDADTHRRLLRWVEEGLRSGHYPPILLPENVRYPSVKITVVKVHHG